MPSVRPRSSVLFLVALAKSVLGQNVYSPLKNHTPETHVYLYDNLFNFILMNDRAEI